MKNLSHKKILIGITGGIAIYKICTLINKLKKEGAVVKVIMTDSATKFITPLTFQSLTNSTVHLDLFNIIQKSDIEHISLADWCDIFVLAPATYNSINKIANGIADNLLTTVISALPKEIPMLIAPAMNCHMWENVILQKNIDELKKIKRRTRNKYYFIGPEKGKLACGYEGEGVIVDNEEIIKTIKQII